MTKVAAIYARVSSDRQKENHTIASQVAALRDYAQAHEYKVPAEWRFQDEGYSGATLLRPGLEALRDLAAAGHLEAVLIYSPDRLSRKYAYQVLLAEELSRCGVELVFLKAPSGATPEDQLLLQFQGMIAEYERAQIAERSRRGKRHRAHQGSINVLSGAPYGYRYVRKSDTAAAYYEVLEAEAAVVRRVYEAYTQAGTEHQRDCPPAQRGADSDPHGDHPLGTIHGLGHAAQSRLPRPRLLWEDRTSSAPTDHASRCGNAKDWRAAIVPTTSGLDRIGSRSPFRPWLVKKTFALAQEQLEQEQTPFSPAHHRTVLVARDAGL